MKKMIAESLGTVHTHTHTLCLLNEEENQSKIIYKFKKIVIKAQKQVFIAVFFVLEIQLNENIIISKKRILKFSIKICYIIIQYLIDIKN